MTNKPMSVEEVARIITDQSDPYWDSFINTLLAFEQAAYDRGFLAGRIQGISEGDSCTKTSGEIAYEAGFKDGQKSIDLSVHGEAFEINGKRIDPMDIYKTPQDYFNDGFREAVEKVEKALDSMYVMKGSENDGMVFIPNAVEKIRQLLPVVEGKQDGKE